MHVYPYPLVGGRREPGRHCAEEQIVEKPFEVRPRVRDDVP
ncbi:hypothetical protein ACIBXA_14425 [Micromonospora echinaurantiaca]|nr:hypothetical protein [Micromonospora sp. S4605]